ncbi:PQQ-dependent sugar dehydrogenase [Escherichia fergusonii]|uniref:PQQ-dependent sugar dehydrogenase n=1 Tax=Escherichia fergusonii TaxID=564 RepID=UPI0015E8FCC9|nr:PQQ-dependent sugar dehydrogenase [Escherichia fergusonii]EGO8190507.1 PQQ-dependent sugar dehydrogenase [Escherichia fergusonii]MBV7578843.1 PQQ-dependent sugar dehydrogenase [Escherichia fergusonii]QME62774.1 PQQ-dependent sugar dehydrogenase [Escherichia fergusonii]QME67385.1 PQQ-dependent sugar dehydrogenase [Escherichia fergusonii]QME99043.1 PQQ-dependent sugar dehydrogenase [Escherichia fergusonii]
MRRVLLPVLSLLISPLVFATPAAVKVEVLQTKLDHPWALAFLPDNQGILITLKGGQLRHWQAGKGLSDPLPGVPQVWANGQGGLLDVALAPDFTTSRRVWLSFAEGDANGKAGTAVGYGRLSEDLSHLSDFKTAFRQTPKLSTGNHFGGRLVFDGKGYLFIGLGENNQRPTAQDLDKLQGKVVRLTDQGQIPPDNPFVNQAAVRPEIWSYGIRNPQGMAMNPWSDALWLNEHGPRGGDEINIPQKGKNYGWPLATWGINYSGLKIPEAKGEIVAGTEQPIFYWKKSPAVSGMAFYNSDTFAQWQQKLFIGALKDKDVIVMSVKGDNVSEDGRILGDRGQRIRDVRTGPDGYLYVLTDESDGELLKVSPRP